jgi:GTPase SAR1 family protein
MQHGETFRVLIIGCSSVGKTNLILRYVNNTFLKEYYPSNCLKTYRKLCKTNTYIELIDTLGFIHDKPNTYRDVLKFLFPGDNSEHEDTIEGLGALIYVFDYNDIKSLEEMLGFAKHIERIEHSDEEDSRLIKCFVCNKYDLLTADIDSNIDYDVFINELCEDKQTEVIFSMIQDYFGDQVTAKEHLFFVSSRYNLGVNFLFDTLISNFNPKDKLEEDIVDLDETMQDLGFFCCKKFKTKPKAIEMNKPSRDFNSELQPLKLKEEDEPGYDDGFKFTNVYQSKENQTPQRTGDQNSCLLI